MAVSQIIKYGGFNDLPISLLVIHTKVMKMYVHTILQYLTTAIFIMAKKWEQPNYLSKDE
jgi:hypothetical protein